MLLRFRFSNFLSFRTEQELSFVAAPLKDRADTVRQFGAVKHGVLTAAGIFGANASGKTNVLKALSFMRAAVEDSHRTWKPDGGVPRQAFRLTAQTLTEPSTFEVDFLLNGIRHHYGFVIDSQLVRQEWLFVYPNNKRQAWFERSVGTPIRFSSKMQGENRTIEGFTRPNSLFLSTAAQNNHAALIPVYRWLSEQEVYVHADRVLANMAANRSADASLRSVVADALRQADLGIAGLNVRAEEPPPALPAQSEEAPDFQDSARHRIDFRHRSDGPPVTFSIEQESRGTVAFLSLLGPVLEALRKGGLVAIDELDAHLHPLLAARLIELFTSPELNRKGAQLIFTTHDTNLLECLRKDEVWLTEKKEDGSSTLYSLSEFKSKRGENLQSGYLQGRYGAIPVVAAETLWKALRNPHAAD
ncbi:MAG: ATP-binding protein [Bryobacterales bacterium]|nr:ATP-binding protein [Bryobacterales bacterium]